MTLQTDYRARRDREIVRRARAGEEHGSIGADYEISAQRVGQILIREGENLPRKDRTGLTPVQFKALSAFARLEARLGRPPSLSELGKARGVSASTMVAILRRIAAHRYITKSRAGGRSWWRLTPSGRRFLGVVCPTCGAKP